MSHNRKRSVEEPSSATNPIVISSDSYDDLADGPSYNDIADYPDFLDGPQISRASTEDEFRYRPDAPVTEDFGASSAPDNIGPCACKDSCAGRRRGRAKPCCALWGISCTPSCACAASATCHNIWDAATKARLFGALEGSVEPRPTACFASWYAARREGKKPPRRNWARSLANPSAKLDALPVAELDYTHLYEVVTKSHSFAESAEWNEGLCAFQDAVKEAGGATPEQAMRLVRFAFTEDRDLLGDGESYGMGYWFSLCLQYDGWVESTCTSHCRVCGSCDDWRTWHCKKCKTCRDGVSIPCEKCGGVSSSYHSTSM